MVVALQDDELRQKASRVKLLCLDLDGTLLDSAKQVSAANRAAIVRAREAGIALAIASGRHPFNVAELCDDLSLPFTAACLSGAYSVLDGREVGRAPLTLDRVEAAIDVAEHNGSYISVAGSDFNFTAGRVDRGPENKKAAVSRYLDFNSYDELRAAVTERSECLLKCALHGESDEIYENLRAELFKIQGIKVAQSDVHWSDVTAETCSKASGVSPLAAALGVSLEDVCSIGDDENDIEVLQAAGLGVAMGNAVAPAATAADMQVADNDHAGVAEAIDFILACR